MEKIALLRSTRINLDSVKSYGVWIDYGPFAPIIVDAKEADEYSLFAFNVIFISTTAHINPIRPNRKETITFQYRKDVYDYVETVLSKRCQQCKSDK